MSRRSVTCRFLSENAEVINAGLLPGRCSLTSCAESVAVAKPEQIVLFGSAARGTMGPNSDVDLLIVKSGRFHRGRLTEAIYRGLRGAEAAVDVVVATPEEIEQYHDDPYLIVASAPERGQSRLWLVSACRRTTRGNG